MPRLTFVVDSAAAVAPAAQPTLTLALRATCDSDDDIASIALRAAVRIDPARRRYDDDEANALASVFGGRDRWNDTLRPFPWTEATGTVAAFRRTTSTTLSFSSSPDFDAAASRYCSALRTATIPLLLLFSGTVFLATPAGLRIDPVPLSAEARFDLPLATWTAALDGFAPGARALLLSRDLLSRLERLRASTQAPTLEAALEKLVPR